MRTIDRYISCPQRTPLKPQPAITQELKWYPAYLPEPGRGGRITKNGDRKWGMPCAIRQHGVYLIREDGVVVYVGTSANCLRKRCYRKFEEPNSYHRTTPEVSYKSRLDRHVYEVAFVVCADLEDRKLIEAHLIDEFKPRDNIRSEILEPILVDGEGWDVVPDEDIPF